MSDLPIDAHVRFDTHPAHTSVVTATLTGTHHRAAQALLAARGCENLDGHTMVLARIDHEEPYWAHQAPTPCTPKASPPRSHPGCVKPSTRNGPGRTTHALADPR
ncbi:hypothetical protein [Streptomyces stelliscabiei]|uniref:hypothetical protein n=1 Tax=Streptomyces stelliscabiei TaxID=146820 RepID=UPI002FF37AB3